MSEADKSYRQILKSSSITGGSSVINILIKIFRIKVLAVLLGPGGVGLVSLYQGLVDAVTALAGLGVGNVGARQIAAANAQENSQAIANARRALVIGTMILAAIGGLSVWCLREVLAVLVLNDPNHSEAVGWLGIAVALSIAGASQLAYLRGMRRVADMARVSVIGALLGTIAGITVIYFFDHRGIIAFILLAPLLSFILGHFYVARIPKVAESATNYEIIISEWKMLLRLGFAFMLTSVVTQLVQLWVKSTVQSALGIEAVGLYQAAVSVSVQYIGFVLVAMGNDYYPRLAGVINNPVETNCLVNQQTEVALLLGGPFLIALMGFSPWVIEFLYSSDFKSASLVLQWHLLGDILKIASWPLGFIILAAGDGRTFFWSESVLRLLFGAFVYFTINTLNIESVGIGYFINYVFYLPLVYILARRRTLFGWSLKIKQIFAGFAALTGITFLCAVYNPNLAAIFTILLFVFTMIFSINRLADVSNSDGKLVRFLRRFSANTKRK